MLLTFTRSFSVPEPPQPLPGSLHYHRYAIADVHAGFSYWQTAQKLAQWNNVEVPHLTSAVNPASIWYSFRTSQVEVHHIPANSLSHFGLKMTIMAPSEKTVNVASLIKPLLDGLIASFHTYNGESIVQVSQNIGKVLGKHPSTIAELLCRPDQAILGNRSLVWVRDNGVQWNPGDDLCLAAELLIRPYVGPTWLISGTLFQIEYLDHTLRRENQDIHEL